MKTLISESLRSIEAKVHKGDIRNTVLRQIKQLETAKKLLNQGRDIKDEEIGEYSTKKPAKARVLKKQVHIITQGLKHIMHAIDELDKYKKTSVH
jgi:hypothetical protein